MASLALLFADSISPLLLGSIVASPLYGVAIAQTISYFRNYPKDSSYIKYFVAILIVTDGAHTISLVNGAANAYFRAQFTLQFPTGILLSIYLAYIITAMVQSAYGLRVWLLSDKKWSFVILLVPLILCQLISGMGMAARQQINGFADKIHGPASQIFGSIELGSAMICDISITVCLVYLLNHRRSGIKKTENLIDRLIMNFIGIGLLTSIFALLNLVTWHAMPQNYDFFIFHSVISKLYVNSFLVTLNSRRRMGNVNADEQYYLSDFGNSGQGVSSTVQVYQ